MDGGTLVCPTYEVTLSGGALFASTFIVLALICAIGVILYDAVNR